MFLNVTDFTTNTYNHDNNLQSTTKQREKFWQSFRWSDKKKDLIFFFTLVYESLSFA